MKTSKIFWGTLFIFLGLLILINNFSSINFYWGDIWQFWPVVLVLLGISILIKHRAGKVIVAAAAAIVLALTIFATFKFTLSFVENDFEVVIDAGDDYEYTVSEYHETFESSITKAILNLDGGIGSFKIDKPTDNLVYVTTRGIENNFFLSKADTDTISNVSLSMKRTNFHIGKSKYKNVVDIWLNEKPLWDLNIDLGAAAIKLDLTKFKLENIEINIGAASLDMKLGSLSEETNLSIDAGASKIVISVPEVVGCQLDLDDVLSANNIVGFEYIKSGLYRTERFDDAEKKIFISIDCGVSSINISRY